MRVEADGMGSEWGAAEGVHHGDYLLPACGEAVRIRVVSAGCAF